MTQIQINYALMKETHRHDLASEQQARADLEEVHRHNVAAESETQRHNLVSEYETMRHNEYTETISRDSLNETIRHNVTMESIESKKVSNEKAKIKETKRHNKATEKIQKATVSEAARHNQMQEQIAQIGAQAQEAVAKAKQVEAQAKANKLNAEAYHQNLINKIKTDFPQLTKISVFSNVFSKTTLDKLGLTALGVDEGTKVLEFVMDSATKMSNKTSTQLAYDIMKKYPKLKKTTNVKNMSKAIEDVLNAIGDILVGGPITAPTGKRNTRGYTK